MPQQADQAACKETRQQQTLEVADIMEQQSDGATASSPLRCPSLAEQMAHLAQARLVALALCQCYAMHYTRTLVCDL